jgi:hypothetical protein
MVSVFPETYFLIALFTGIAVWMIVTEGWSKKIIAILMSTFLIALVGTNTVSYILVDDHKINFTGFEYSGNKVMNATNMFIDPSITRTTTTQLSSIQQILQYFSVLMLGISVSVLLIEINFMNIGSAIRREKSQD